MGSVVKEKLRDETRSFVLFAIYTSYAYILYISIFDRPFLTPLQDKYTNETVTTTDPPDYGNSAATVTLIVLASLALGRATEWASLPSLLGMLLAGIALRNLPLSFFCSLTVPREWATVLRRASFVVILLRGALSLDGESLKRTKGACLRLSLLPCTLEALVIACVSVLIFDISILFGLLLGQTERKSVGIDESQKKIFSFLLAAASPAVVVPSIIKVAQDGYGTHLSSMIIASCSLDDVYNISMFSVLLSILFSTGDSLFLTLIRAPIQVVAGCLMGGLIGFLGRFAPTESRFSLLLSTSMTVYFGCVYARIDSCGTLAVLVAAFLAVSEWRKKEGYRSHGSLDMLLKLLEFQPDCNSEQAKLRSMWELLFQANPNGKDHTEEKVITEVECETEGFRDHKAPAVIENVIVKVECEAGSARDHNAPEAKVKVRGHETNDAGYTEIFLQDRYSDIVRVAPENTVVGKSSRVEKKAKFKPISERDNPIQCDHLSSEIDMKTVIPSEAFVSNLNLSFLHRLVLLGCAILAIGVAVRTIVAFFAVMGAGLTTRERAFVALSWPSKATVQAALATAAIDLVDKGGYGEEYRKAAVIVFSLAVLSILTTAPIGAILIRISAPLLLTKETKDDQRF
ncbi:hypothetical protein PRIPAC_73496 [Pristionchus pacificus]|uniref:Na/H antiporter n=1 Tax=Pristionchus pacificus TaxID=54126 RepID=A0A2A6CFF6_PRIPA|nr:hypothetical protein PRIPAC_73496 [Pristionchus pacificus]|eukprot:PDM76818.1 Na/H antiporter [Pristionchus pacificus]